jgi:hypothetical protein
VDLLTPGSISPKIFPLIQKDLKLIYERGWLKIKFLQKNS